MRKWKQRLWSLLLCGAMLVSLCVPAEAADASGDIDTLHWSFEESTGTLTYTGTGATPSMSEEFEIVNFIDKIKSVVIESGITELGDFAFANCASLREITLPGSLTTIGQYAFGYCTSLREITLPDRVNTIGEGAFSYCTSLREITLPDSLTTIGEGAFSDCTSLREITLPGDLTTIGDSAFSYCTNLTEITLPDDLTIIGENAFQSCTDLASITFTRNTPPTIKVDAFRDCGNLKEIRVPAEAAPAYTQMLSNIGLNLGDGGIELKGGYSITVTATAGGTAFASPDFAAEGDTITLNAVPDRGYRFKEWQVESGGVTVDSGGFVMPAEAVTVKAVFEKEAAPQPPSHTHAWASDWSRDDDCHWHECLAEGCTILSDSGKDGYAAHIPGEWIIDQAPTSSTAGSKHKEYTVCGYTTQTGAIPATGGGSGGGGGGGGSSGGGYTPPTYKPDVPQPSEGGSVSVSPSSPKQGDTVTVKPRPDEGYEVDKIMVTDRNGKPVELTAKPDGTYTFKQPGGKVKIVVTYKPVDTKPVETPWNNPFADVSEDDWYYEAVKFVQERGLMNGYSDGRFGPDDTLSRAQLAQILFNKEGRPGADSLPNFSDVAGEAWYAEAVRWAAGQGIVGGYGDGTFGPNDPITREQLAVMLWRYSGSPAATGKELNFNDEAEIGGFALDAIRWAVENGILNGYGDGRLGPQGQATRAQVAQMLKNFIENQEKDN